MWPVLCLSYPVSLGLVVALWERHSLVILNLASYLFSGFVGLTTIDNTRRTSGMLKAAKDEPDATCRLRQLREVARRYPGDPVCIGILRLTYEVPRPD